MSYFLREIVSREQNSSTPSVIPQSTKISEEYAELIKRFHTIPKDGCPLRLPNSKESCSLDDDASRFPTVSGEIASALQVVGAPSSFSTMAIAKNLLAKYARLLSTSAASPSDNGNTCDDLKNDETQGKADIVTNATLSCVFDVLVQMSERDPELCVQALGSLLALLQKVPVDGLRNEPKTAIDGMMRILKQLREKGSLQVSSRASSCLAALSAAAGQPHHLMAAVQSLISCKRIEPGGSDSTYDLLEFPENLHKLCLKVQHKIFQGQDGSCSWTVGPLSDHRSLCSFDLPQLPFDSPSDTPDDDLRLNGATASDGKYVFVLNYIGLYKLGTGLQETILGKLYASNHAIKATKNCMLTFCNSSLYLRRGQSSCISVVDTDSLRDIGEVMLPANAMQAALFSDGFCFYSANINQQFTLTLTPLNDSFMPSSDAKSLRKFRLTDVSYVCIGDKTPIPHDLPLNLHVNLHSQAVDLHMGREIAFLQSRAGKVFYAGSGQKYGLQETGTTWMELVLPEPVVQLSVGTDRVLFRSGSGHVWVAGGDERRRTGKLRRLATVGRRKAISICCSGGAFAYVTDNGRVYLLGRHGMRVHPESGHVQGLDGVHMATVSLGKTHAVAVSRHGHLYTWGLNNLNQCGRSDDPPTSSPSPQKSRKGSVVACSPAEHLWVKDVASICLQCGLCSARGAACPLGPTRGGACSCGPGESACLRCGLCRPCGEGAVPSSSSGPPTTPSRTFLPPARLILVKSSHDVKIAAVSCGNFHTILLAADRRVFAFGSNCHGQLGAGDARSRTEPVQVVLPAGLQVVQVSAGSNHSVLRTADGAVYTFGAHKNGQLARPPGEGAWHCFPERVDGFGPGQPSFASWVGAVGDTTLIHSHKGLITNDDVIDAQIVASKNDLFIFPRHIGVDYVAIRRKLNSFSHYQLGPAGLYTSWCLEPMFDTMWSYNAAEMRVVAQTIYTESPEEPDFSDPLEDLSFMRCPEFAVPQEGPTQLTSNQLALHLLSSVYAVSTIYKSPFWTDKTYISASSSAELTSSDGYCVVKRFEGTGGGWGYSAHSIEAIQFMTNKDIKLLGVGLYGGRGEYIAKLKLFRLLGEEVDEMYVEHLTETDETLFDCGPRETAALMLAQPQIIRANQWHVVSAKISGPSSDCGANGKGTVESDEVIFTFRNSMVSNNGTDVTVGQLPELYYQIEQQSMDQPANITHHNELSVCPLFSASSLDTVSPSVISSLLAILDWSLAQIFDQSQEGEELIWETEKAATVASLALRMLGRYVLLVYPLDFSEEPSLEYAQLVSQLHDSLLRLFHTANSVLVDETYCHRHVLSEAIRLFLSLSHIFLPSHSLVSLHLTDIMINNVEEVRTAAILGCIAKKNKLLDLFLHCRDNTEYPRLSNLLAKSFPKIDGDKVKTMTSFSNILRFLYEKCFLPFSSGKYDVAVTAQEIVVKISEELSIPDLHDTLGPTLQQSPARFRRRSSISAWEMSDHSADAISLRVDADDVIIHGIGVYLQTEPEAKSTWNCEIYRLCSDGVEQWESIMTSSADITCSASSDVGVVRLPTELPLMSGRTYAVKLWTNENGTRTYCGEGGVAHVRLSNGSRLHFNSCSLSENGTTLQRGQIPFVVYSIQTKKEQHTDMEKEELHKSFLLLIRLLANAVGSNLASGQLSGGSRSLMSRISSHVLVFMERNPNRTIEIISILEQLIPMVSSVNGAMKTSTLSESFDRNSEICDPKSAQVVVESPHPYKTNTVHSMVVGFDSSVDFMCIQFSAMCETAQADDQLWIYLGIQRDCYTPVGRYFGRRDWPKSPILVPGNSLWFVLETNAEVEGINPEQMYGFHCTITGYPAAVSDSRLRLEQELAWLSASACRILTQLPNDPSSLSHLCIAEDDTRLMLEKHGNLLKKGLNLSHAPTFHELVSRGIPPPAQTQDLLFLREFVIANPSTTPGLLARWLPAGPVVDPTRCQLTLVQSDIVVGKPVTIRVTTKDQFDRCVVCPLMDVDVTMSSGSSQSNSIMTQSQTRTTQQLIMQNAYQPVLLNRARYMSICAQPVFADVPYEELRLAMRKEATVTTTVRLKHKKNSTFITSWTPTVPGVYRVEGKVDGFGLSHTYTIHVLSEDTTEEENKTRKENTRTALLSRAQLATIPSTAGYQGVRMRNAPSLTATALGVIPRGGSISYIEEIDNEDGKWLRLTDETAILYGSGSTTGQVWCLAYHQHLRLVLIPTAGEVKEGDRLQNRRRDEHPTPPTTTSQHSVIIDTNEMYILEAGECLCVYTRPSPDAMIEGERVEGRREISSDGWVSNQYGVWIRMSGTQRYVLAESSVGRSSIHSQSLSANGNEDEETSPPPRNQAGSSLLTAVRPLVSDCTRAVFAAFIWHEHLVKDAMAAAAYLKFHQHLHNIWSSAENLPTSSAPTALQPIVRLWKEVCQAVQASVDQHLIMPPSVGKACTQIRKRETKQGGGCELCEDSFRVPVTVHMRMAHPGCGEDTQGYGYNSNGKFISGWSGDCGGGGRPGSTWYLLCTACRNKYLRKTPAGHRQERTRRWREFRLSATAFEARPEVIIKQNALFLLDLNSSLDYDSKCSSTSSGWTVNLFPTQTPSPMNRSTMARHKLDTSQLARSSFMAQSIWRGGGHSSDPGPKGPPVMSPPTQQAPTSSLGQYRVTPQGTYDQDSQEVLQSPSAALRTLFSHSTPSTVAILKRPVLAFVVEHHNLKRMRSACEQSIRRAVGFSHAFRVWNWLLRLVSSETSVSDIIFQYLTALSSYHRLTESVPSVDNKSPILPHPWRLCFLAGPLAGKMVHQFHAFLYTIAVILQSSGVDSKLRSLCFKAWTIQLTAHEQELLILTCDILATVGGVLSDGTTSENWVSGETDKQVAQKELADVKDMRDLTASTRIEASSRQAMTVCLADGSPDTFWESGEEDKSRVRSLTIKCEANQATPILLTLFLDNVRDDGYRTSQCTFRATLPDGSRRDLLTRTLESSFCGWIKCCIAGTSHVQVVLKGPNNALRVRQLMVLGFSSESEQELLRPSTSHQLFFNNTQLDAFALFQAISAQAFGEELCDDHQGTLRERVIDLLCSRVQLQPLQNYVGTQVVNALEREVEMLCCQSKKNYSYACGLLDMLVRICGGRKSGELFAARNTILIATSQLIIFAPQVVQCQALHSLEKFLSVFSPDGVDVARFLRNILVVVAKVIVLQVRDKAAHTVATAVMNDSLHNAPSHWRVDRTISHEIGRLTTQLMNDICSAQFSVEWSEAMRRELAGALLNVVQLTSSVSSSSASRDSINRDSVASFLASKRFWLSVSALALVKEKAWLSLADKWSALVAQREEQPETICDNHDDGVTIAQVYCTVCETALCRECFTVMHLHKKNRSHRVQSLNQNTRPADIDIHQGCARMRLQQLLVLFHGDSLNGLVEISNDFFNMTSYIPPYSSTLSLTQQHHQCRFCGNALDGQKQLYPGVCDHEDCQSLAPNACDRLLPCGHFCGGIRGEASCLSCLNCHAENNQQDCDDVCVVCFTDRLGAAPTVKLECEHLFHFHCLRTILEKRWNGPRIHFRFIHCPLCNQQLCHPGLSDLLDPILALKKDVMEKSRMRLEYDGLLQCTALTDENSEYFNRVDDYAMDRYMYVLCSKCNKAYFGGESRCQQALNTSQYNPDDLICGGCSDTTGTQVCGRHGVEFLEYKCRFCCSIAVYFCFGTTHFCASCHDDFQRLMCLPKTQLPRCPAGPRGVEMEEGPCPLKIEHPPTGEEFAMGCGICRNISTF